MDVSTLYLAYALNVDLNVRTKVLFPNCVLRKEDNSAVCTNKVFSCWVNKANGAQVCLLAEDWLSVSIITQTLVEKV